ncbi:MAG TPA: hypothetical protein VFD06_06255 [Candidatus Polarisedimenticolia bacterium]|nr:hypothetical protein [Candidatus Polarisedimenticolia bacterium]
MTRRTAALLVGSLLAGAALAADPPPIPLSAARAYTALGVKVEETEYRGRRALRVVEPKINEGGGIALANGVTFANGTIEVDVAGLPAAGAVEASRGFIGIAFRVQTDPQRYECLYLRPTNGRADDQLRRNHSTQYVSEPEFPWHRLRKEQPGVYESYVDLEPGAWTRLRIVVDGTRARLYVHDAPQPALIVNDLKLGDTQGGIALWIGQGTEAYFSSLTITPR